MVKRMKWDGDDYDWVDRCIHGVPTDYDCEECKEIRRRLLEEDEHDIWWEETNYGTSFDSEIEKDSKRYPEW